MGTKDNRGLAFLVALGALSAVLAATAWLAPARDSVSSDKGDGGAAELRPTYITPTRPAHRWVWNEGDVYGYAGPPSPAERLQGMAHAPLTRAKLSSRDSFSVVVLVQPAEGGILEAACGFPCEYVKIKDRATQQTMVIATSGTLIGDIIEDAREGFLDPKKPAP